MRSVRNAFARRSAQADDLGATAAGYGDDELAGGTEDDFLIGNPIPTGK